MAAIVYFTLAGLLTYYFAKGERDQRNQQEILASTLEQTNKELQDTQQQLMDRLTEVAQMEERLQRITQMATLGEVAGQLAHEIRNPFGIIKARSLSHPPGFWKVLGSWRRNWDIRQSFHY